MIAHAGDTTPTTMEEQQEPEETRTVRMVDLSRDNLAGETIEMEIDEARAMDSNEEDGERNAAMGKGRGNGRGGRFRDNKE